MGVRRLAQRGAAWSSVLLFLAVLAAACWAWWYYAPQTLPKVVLQLLPPAKDALAPAKDAPAPAAPQPLLYKWRDAQGRWNITDHPPEGRPFEAVRIDPNTNVLPAGVPPEPDR